MHLLIEHSAYLIATRGPLGFWSQQSIEASHKVTKDIFRRGTNHDGRRKGGTSAPFQIILRQGRILVGAARCLSLVDARSDVPPMSNSAAGQYCDQLLQISRDKFALTSEERAYCDYANNKVVNRIKRSLADIAAQGAIKRRRREENNPSEELLQDSDTDDTSLTASEDSDYCSDDGPTHSEQPLLSSRSGAPHQSLVSFLDTDIYSQHDNGENDCTV